MAQSVTNRHEAVIDYMLDNPEASKKDVAEAFGYTTQYFYTMTATDIFQKALEDRREMRRGRVDCAIIDIASAGALAALAKVHQILQEEKVNPKFALDAADTLMKRLGFGERSAGSAKQPVQVNLQNNVSISDLTAAQQKAKEVYIAPDTQVSPQPLPPPGELTEHFEDVPASLLGLLEGPEYEEFVHNTESTPSPAEDRDGASEGEGG